MLESEEDTKKRHLRRLDLLFPDAPIFFITTCTHQKRRVLADEQMHAILVGEWRDARKRHGWQVGAYVVMPDHVHFFARPVDEVGTKTLATFVGAWKEWTSKRVNREAPEKVGAGRRLWQAEFFDHVLRSSESYSEKWDYVGENPARAGLVNAADDWPYAGTIGELMW